MMQASNLVDVDNLVLLLLKAAGPGLHSLAPDCSIDPHSSQSSLHRKTLWANSTVLWSLSHQPTTNRLQLCMLANHNLLYFAAASVCDKYEQSLTLITDMVV